jgi:lipopolysaccharide/colanic/teichoic acid biosynthesis glycosyltransferase
MLPKTSISPSEPSGQGRGQSTGSRILRLLTVLAGVAAIAFALHWAVGSRFYSVVTVEVPQEITMTFLQKSSKDKLECDRLGQTVASVVLSKCSECRLQRQACLHSLPSELGGLLGETPIPIPSARIRNGIITFTHANPEVSLAACLESQRQAAATGAVQFVCDRPGTPRPLQDALEDQDEGLVGMIRANWSTVIELFFIAIAVLLALQLATVRHPSDMQSPDGNKQRPLKASKILKRLWDVSIAAVLLVILFPAFLAIATMIFILEGLPIFYLSRRFVSKDQSVPILKFRTMVSDATSPKYRLRERFMRDGYLDIPLSCEVYTPVGRFLERTQLVESLQLLNILVHGMSLVGNRPLPKDNIDLLSRMPEWEQRFDSPAGITGLSQVVGKFNQSPAERLELERLYSKAYLNPSVNILWVDFAIYFYTARMLLLNRPLSLEDARSLCGEVTPSAQQ